MVAANTDMVHLKGRTDVSHIPYQPLWLFIVRCIQLLLAIIILGLSAYASSGYYIVYGGYGIGIFSFVWTLLFLCYLEISTFFVPVAYNKYAHLVLEILSVIFWLSTFGALAALAAVWDWGYGYTSSPYINTTKAAAALGAIEWALFVGSLIAYGIYLHRHRRAEQETRGVNPTGAAVVEEHKMQPVVSQQPANGAYQPQVQQAYPQQPQAGPYQQPIDPRYQQQTMA